MRGRIHVQTNPDPSRGRSVVSGQLSIPLSYRTPKKDCQGLKKKRGAGGREGETQPMPLRILSAATKFPLSEAGERKN